MSNRTVLLEKYRMTVEQSEPSPPLDYIQLRNREALREWHRVPVIDCGKHSHTLEEASMNKSLARLALICAIGVAPAQAADVGFPVSIGEPGFYGRLNMGNAGRPPVIYSQPVIVEHRYHNLAPIYLRVPPGQAKNWRRQGLLVGVSATGAQPL